MTTPAQTAGPMRVFHREDHGTAFSAPSSLQEISDNLRRGDCVYIFKHVVPAGLVEAIKKYLSAVGSASLPNYAPLSAGCPNFHRMVRWEDARSAVRGCYQLFSFFPWNHDYFDLFGRFREVYHARNILAGADPGDYIGRTPTGDLAARLSFQFYPKGGGGLNKHSDPKLAHQMAVPVLTMSRKGSDFSAGGLFVEAGDGSKLYLDDLSEPGDVVYFNASAPHGVDPIDPEEEQRWLDFEGRWMGLFAVNSVSAAPEYRSADLGAAG